MIKEMYLELKKIYDEAIAIDLPVYVPGGENAEAKKFLALRNQYEKMVKSMDADYTEIEECHAEHYNIVNMRSKIDKKLKDHLAEAKRIAEAK